MESILHTISKALDRKICLVQNRFVCDRIKYYDLFVGPSGFILKDNQDILLVDGMTEIIISVHTILSAPDFDFVFVGFPNDDRVCLLDIKLVKKFPRSVLYGFYEAFGLDYNEKCVLESFTYEQFEDIIGILEDPNKILTASTEIIKLLDLYGFIHESVYLANQALIEKNAQLIKEYENRLYCARQNIIFKLNHFLATPNSAFFVRAEWDYNIYKNMFADNTRIIPVQCIVEYDYRGRFYDANRSMGLICTINILDGLPLYMLDYREQHIYYKRGSDEDEESEYILDYTNIDTVSEKYRRLETYVTNLTCIDVNDLRSQMMLGEHKEYMNAYIDNPDKEFILPKANVRQSYDELALSDDEEGRVRSYRELKEKIDGKRINLGLLNKNLFGTSDDFLDICSILFQNICLVDICFLSNFEEKQILMDLTPYLHNSDFSTFTKHIYTTLQKYFCDEFVLRKEQKNRMGRGGRSFYLAKIKGFVHI